jgi:hypothetical protein
MARVILFVKAALQCQKKRNDQVASTISVFRQICDQQQQLSALNGERNGLATHSYYFVRNTWSITARAKA